jgi:CCR4-NOT transcription complex subunit 7/8
MLNKECASNRNEKKSSPANISNDSTSIEELSIIKPLKSLSHIERPFSYNIIKEVYEDNFIEELKKITTLIEEDFTIVGMDTEFPGIVYNSNNYTKQNFYYETLKININSLKLIQLGITLKNKKGEFPSKYPYFTWQFNFKFDLKKDSYCQKSLKLLKNAGINFEKIKNKGIEHKKFAVYFMTSGLVLNPEINWICFQGSYDFGYLLKLLINEPLPEKENDFIELLKLYFPKFYDIRMLAKDKCCLQGSLNKLSKRLKIDRGTGDAHQAGSDSYITIEIYYKLIKCGIANKELMKKNKNILYGIGLGQDNDNMIRYMKKNDNENNNNKNNNVNFGTINVNNNFLNSYNYESINYMSNNFNNFNNYLYSNKLGINCNLINVNYFGFNYFNSNLLYYDNIKNILKRY